MRYHNITKDDMLNGDGLRTVLWLSGCSHCCKDCHNPVTWDANGGLPFDATAREELFGELAKDYISGVTLSGGDPLYYANRSGVLALLEEICGRFPQKNVWMYTGFVWETVCDLRIMDYVDVLVDGEFVAELQDPQLYWRGSSNQRVIDVKESKALGRVKLHCL